MAPSGTSSSNNNNNGNHAIRVWVKMQAEKQSLSSMDASIGGSARRGFSRKQVSDPASLSPKSSLNCKSSPKMAHSHSMDVSGSAPLSPYGARRTLGTKKSFDSLAITASGSSLTATNTTCTSTPKAQDAPVVARAAAPWLWKTGVMLENSVESGITVRLVDETSGHELPGESNLIRLSADALNQKQVLLANSYPTSKEGALLCPNDLISLTHLHEPSVVECLIHRYQQEKIYTNTGPVLLALNPFHAIAGLYDDATMRQYWHHAESNDTSRGDELPPHVYAVADVTFRNMMRKLEMADSDVLHKPTGCDQSILVSGESGAGKTVTMKFAMKYLAALSQRLSDFHAKAGKPSYLGIGKKPTGAALVQGKTTTDPLALRGHTFGVVKSQQPTSFVPSPKSTGSAATLASASVLMMSSQTTDSIENKVLQSNPILESFGNARTIRNDNSSRFGKFIQMQFTRYGKLVGSQIETYLLEKVRIITQTVGERNYHIFYEFMSGGMDFRELKNFYLTSKHTPADFKITANGTYDRRDGVPDSDTYRELRRAMNIMNFSPEVQKNIFNVTAAILHASNLTWMEKLGEESAVDVTNPHLEAVCNLLNVTPDDMTQSLCYYSITVQNTQVRKSLSKAKAEHGFEALLKALYGALFTSLVRRINESISYKEPPKDDPTHDDPLHTPASFIGILDIFGFESFTVNSFEQLVRTEQSMESASCSSLARGHACKLTHRSTATNSACLPT
jgi:Myosin head (motor domain)